MRLHRLTARLGLLLLAAPPAVAFGEDQQGEPVEREEPLAQETPPPEEQSAEEAEEGGFAAYRARVRNRWLMGVNSLLTFPADPVMGYAKPNEAFDEWPNLPLALISRRLLGFFHGTLLGAYRGSMGALDVLFSWITPIQMLSPEPRYMLFEGVEHEVY